MNDERRKMDDERIERALQDIGRAEPANDLSARIIANLPRAAQTPNVNVGLGVVTLLAALLGFALAYQSAFTLRANGAFDLVSYYTTQPEIVTMYPSEAWRALAAAIPWMSMGISMVMLAVAFWLTARLTARPAARAAG